MIRARTRFLVLAAMCFVGFASTNVWAQAAKIVVPEVETHLIESKIVDQTFEIYVQVPWHRTDGTERFPVLYLTDSYGSLAFDDTTAIMQLGGDVPRFIAVGIGYKMGSRAHALEIRTRDLTQVEGESDSPRLSTFVEGVPSPELDRSSGGAPDFLRFIREELQPFIDEKYPTDPEDRGYWGDSLGGLFGLYVLFNQPDTFNRYIIGSPSIWWGDKAIMEDAKAYIESNDRLDAKVFMGVGALEELGGTEASDAAMVTNMFQLEQLLRSANLEGLQLTTHLFPNETHTSVIGMNYSRGIQAVYNKPARSMLLDMMAPAPKEE